MSSRILLLLIAGAAGVWSFRRWRKAVQLAMLLLVFEGALRKWVFPGAQDLIYFAKDGVLLAAYAGFLNDRTSRLRTLRIPPFLAFLLASGVAIGLLEIFNPHLPNLWVGLFGFKAYFLYVPLLWVVPAAFESRRELWRFLYIYAIVAIPLGLLAMAQFAAPASSALNTYARHGDSPAFTFGSSTHARVTSTFSFITGYSSYLFATALLLLCLVGTARWQIRRYYALYIALGMTLIGMLASGSRAPVFMLAATAPLYWWLTAARDRQGFLAVSRILIVAALLGVLLSSTSSDLATAFYGRASGGHDVAGRLTSPFREPFDVFHESGVGGYGIGATHQAAQALVEGVRPYSWIGGISVEDEGGRVMLELGPFGFVVLYLARIYLIVFAFRQAVILRDRFARQIAVACMLFLLTSLPSGIVFNVTAGLFYWFFAGMLFLAMRFDRELAPERSGAAEPGRPPVLGRTAPAVPAGASRSVLR